MEQHKKHTFLAYEGAFHFARDILPLEVLFLYHTNTVFLSFLFRLPRCPVGEADLLDSLDRRPNAILCFASDAHSDTSF